MTTAAPPPGEDRPPVLGRPAERADASRNRAKILAAAEDLVRSRGMAALTMNEVAAAGVGVGTVYRRFGDHAGLVEAMMDDRERRLQRAMSAGPPPLGPGAPAPERIRAFLHAYADVLDTYGPLMAAVEATMPTPRRYRTGPYAVHHEHLAALITEARPGADAFYLADALLAPLAAGLFTHQRQHDGMSSRRIKAGLDDLLRGFGLDRPSRR
ncbi:TetR/AcrR family transcriptional regulator [Actinomadura rubrisoli]|uniref:TetR/AcrR family transcriptional regulator n=1 Tax=Actinomadura rubrisoli TaxID=2530368 RepID=A0A4R5C2R4_9ACTN|nr:TetR/AcrR family transcriptional regulator [Actinomadura rubrisoli]TDD92626.1 TetR/AcrR family transcriptional regulator [Actinomadura rubrisoli]